MWKTIIIVEKLTMIKNFVVEKFYHLHVNEFLKHIGEFLNKLIFVSCTVVKENRSGSKWETILADKNNLYRIGVQ